MMTLQQLRDLLAVVSHGGYRAAARALQVSQAGLTKSLANLEDTYGVHLLQRTAKGVLLTAEGENLVHHARAILREADRADAWLRSLTQPAPVLIKLGVSIDPSLRLAPVVLKDFRNACPEATVHITQRASSALIAAIRDNQLDLAVVRTPPGLEAHDLRIEPLYTSSAVILCRQGHPRQYATTMQELASSEWVVVGDPALPGQQDDSIRELFLEQHLGGPRFAAVSDSVFGAVSLLLESDCLARLPAALLQHPLTAGTLRAIRLQAQPFHPYEISLIYKAGRRPSRETAQLVTMLTSFSRLLQGVGQPPR